jgi:hypothetical protein
MLVGYLIQDSARRRLSGRLRGLGGGFNCSGDGRQKIKRVGIGCLSKFGADKPDGRLLLGAAV